MAQQIKCILLGDSAVGKSSLINQYVNRRFQNDFRPTLGSDFSSKSVSTSDGQVVTLSIWDTAGQDRLRSLCQSFYRGSEVVLCVFDITNAQSFDDIPEWVQEFQHTCGISSDERFPIFVIGNKKDLDHERAIPAADAERFCASRGWRYFETSAKLADGVDYLFREAASAAMARRR